MRYDKSKSDSSGVDAITNIQDGQVSNMVMLKEDKKILDEAMKFRTQDKKNQIFLDIYDPYYREVIDSERQLFKLDSIEKINEGCAARIVLRNADNNNLIAYIPMRFSKTFRMPNVFLKAKHLLLKKKAVKDYFDISTGRLYDGNYKISVVVDFPDHFSRTREHLFSVKCGYAEPVVLKQRRMYCNNAWRDLFLREYGAMPCCNLKRDEKVLYNTHYKGGYDPWNNKGMVALRQSIVSGTPKYCHPGCPSLTYEPFKINSFADVSGMKKLGLNFTNNLEKLYKAYLEGKTVLDVGPMRISVSVGTICNVDCTFCIIPYQKNKHTILNENVIALLEKHLPTMDVLILSGGEPLIYLNKLKHLEPLFHNNLVIHFITNGILIDRLVDFATNSKFFIKLSLNTSSRETYKYLHGKDNFDRIIKGIKKLKEKRGKILIKLKHIVMKTTYKEIFDFAVLCKELQVDQCSYTTLYVKKQTKINPDEKILFGDPECQEADKLLQKAESFLDEHGIQFTFAGWDDRPDDLGRIIV